MSEINYFREEERTMRKKTDFEKEIKRLKEVKKEEIEKDLKLKKGQWSNVREILINNRYLYVEFIDKDPDIIDKRFYRITRKFFIIDLKNKTELAITLDPYDKVIDIGSAGMSKDDIKLYLKSNDCKKVYTRNIRLGNARFSQLGDDTFFRFVFNKKFLNSYLKTKKLVKV
jgi:hypothetical protein